ncbi:MAG: hypothetical protein HY788_10390 [Deltaproteobacteria bacterium]|nr:hypothetical protein [Deltaproteobacteria bacterium]
MVTEIFCSTVIRGATDKDITGFFYHILWPEKRILSKIPVPAVTKGFGARGGSRGGRGLLWRDGFLFACACDKIIVYDERFRIAELFNHPHIIGHHDLAADDEGLWCNSTLIDALFKLDWNGNIVDEWYASEDREFLQLFEGDDKPAYEVPRPRRKDYVSDVDREGLDVYDEQFHFNTLHVSNGAVYTFGSAKYALVQVRPQPTLVQRNPRWKWAHNVTPLNDAVIVNNSVHKCFERYRPGVDHPEICTKLDETDGTATQFATSGWVRGLARADERHVFVGSSPSTIFLVDMITGAVVDRMLLADNIVDAVHAIAVKTPR